MSEKTSFYSNLTGLISGFVFVLLLMTLLTLLGLRNLKNTYNDIEFLVDNNSRKNTLIMNMRIAARERALNLQYMILHDDPFDRDKFFMEITRFGSVFLENRIALLELVSSEKEKEMLARQAAITGNAIPNLRLIADLASLGRVEEARRMLLEKGIPVQNQVLGILDEMVEMGKKDMKSTVQKAQHKYQAALATMLSLFLAAAVLCILMAVYVIRQNTRHTAILEQEVSERTASLAGANAEIKQLNERLKAENLRMGSELEIARRLQKMVLPKTEELLEISDLDVAAFMEAATEVGGDYYDIIQHREGHVTISIGDVAGHGLESGVLMLMVQSAVRALSHTPVRDLTKLLDALNRMVYQNVRRMGVDKNLTFTLLEYCNGKVNLTGQHEELIIVRKNGTIERLDTLKLGFFLGVIEDMNRTLKNASISLEPGDGMVLYTDGITEAFDANENVYGVEKLCAVISQHWMNNSAAHIKEMVIHDVREHMGHADLTDDLTLVVLKRQAERLLG